MKKINILKLFIVSVIISVATINVFLNLDSQNENLSVDVTLSNVEALAYELPEVEVYCGQTFGVCNEYITSYPYCRFTGKQSDFCYPW